MKKNKYVTGIEQKKPLIGPKVFQIDLTNDCNFNCVGCWCHSDLMGDKCLSLDEKKQYLDFSLIQDLIIDLAALETKRIILAGAGEPCMHPHIKEIIRLIKSNGMELELITNFSLITSELLETILVEQVDQLTVSLWAGDAETYVKTHPNQTKKTFFSIKNNLIALNTRKDKLPLVRLYNVISSLNYKTISRMISFAVETCCDSVEFQVIDTVPNKTDHLDLTEAMLPKIKKEFEKAKKITGYLQLSDRNKLTELQEFGRYVLYPLLPSSFKYFFTNSGNHKAICPNKKTNIAVTYNHRLEQAELWFDQYICDTCKHNKICPVAEEGKLNVPFTTVLGYRSFLRRIQEGVQSPSTFINEIPCYAGYIYSKVRVNGDIVPCCKADKVPMGNISNARFKDIWVSKKYQTFRTRAAKTHNKDTYYFPKINCLKSCDNYGMNLQMINELQQEKTLK